MLESIWDYNDPGSFVSRRRRARSVRVMQMIEAVHREKGRCRILDIGGEPNYWKLYPRDRLKAMGVHITLVNIRPVPVQDDLMESRQGDATALDLPDNSFDLAHSNSVIEHVGLFSAMERFAAEVRRVAPAYYVQTPYFWFPVEPHFRSPFLHWLPEPIGMRIVMRSQHGTWPELKTVGLATSALQGAKLLDKTQFRYLFPDAEHHDERVFGLTKSLMATRAG